MLRHTRKLFNINMLHKKRTSTGVARAKVLSILINIHFIVNVVNNTNLDQSWHEKPHSSFDEVGDLLVQSFHP